jgi:hypothetical protein
VTARDGLLQIELELVGFGDLGRFGFHARPFA